MPNRLRARSSAKRPPSEAGAAGSARTRPIGCLDGGIAVPARLFLQESLAPAGRLLRGQLDAWRGSALPLHRKGRFAADELDQHGGEGILSKRFNTVRATNQIAAAQSTSVMMLTARPAT